MLVLLYASKSFLLDHLMLFRRENIAMLCFLAPGDQFALFESVVALAMLVRRFNFRLDPAAPPVGMTTGATIHTSAGLHMFLTPRQPTEVRSYAHSSSVFPTACPALRAQQECQFEQQVVRCRSIFSTVPDAPPYVG